MNIGGVWMGGVDGIRALLGYKFPPLGPLAFRATFSLLPDEAFVEIVRGIRVRANFRDLTFRSTYWQGPRFEGRAIDRLEAWLASAARPVFFDIGSNYGFFSFLIYSRFPRAEIHAFEPNPLTYDRLNEAVQLNYLSRIHPHPMGLSDRRDELLLSHGTRDLGHSTFGNHPGLIETPKTRIAVQAFDDWVLTAELAANTTWVAKIDVEGFEPRVLKGMAQALHQKRFSGLMVEINPFTLAFNNSSPDQIYKFMDECGYAPLIPGKITGHHGNQFFIPR